MSNMPIWLSVLLALALASACLFGFFYVTEQVADKGTYYWYGSFAFIILVFLVLVAAIASLTNRAKVQEQEQRDRHNRTQLDYKERLREISKRANARKRSRR